MAVNLQKGQKISLAKEGGAGLKRVTVGLGWDEAKRGLFSRMQDIDCDAEAIVLTDDRIANKNDVVFYNNLKHPSQCVIHMGDNLTGGGAGDDEQIMVYLDDLPQQYNKIVFAVTIYQAFERRQHFGMIQNAFIRIVDADRNQEICRFNLTENYDNRTSMIFGELYRHNGEWKFNAVGEGYNDNGIGELIRRFAR